MTLTVQIDDGACLAHGDCVHAAPGVFELTGDVAERGRAGHRRPAARRRPRVPGRRDHPVRRGDRRGSRSVVTGPVRPVASWATIATRRTSAGTRSRGRRVVCVLVVPSARVTATM